MNLSYEKLEAKHLPYFYEIRFSVKENILHDYQIQYLLKENALNDINQGGGWICKVNDDYVGFCFGVFIPHALIGGLFVKPEYQSKGIGTTLLKLVTNWFYENKALEIKLTTDIGSKAETFYKKNKWIDCGIDEYGSRILKKHINPENKNEY
jgi:GNAT superfamily N-acetyltransferase